MGLDLIFIRLFFVLILSLTAFLLHPAQVSPLVSTLGGLLLGGGIIYFEIRLEKVSLTRLIGAAVGSVLGIAGAFLMSLVVEKALPGLPLLPVCLLLWMTYVGLIVGAKKGDMLNLAALGGVFGGEKSSQKSFKILDTSVIIDGRIADIAETGFLDGVLTIPAFVLRELQLVADSADSLWLVAVATVTGENPSSELSIVPVLFTSGESSWESFTSPVIVIGSKVMSLLSSVSLASMMMGPGEKASTVTV